MSGHSKWSTIKRKKGALDQKRGKVFTRCIHEITVAVKEGGGADPNSNPRLRFAIDKAKSSNMPNDTIERAIRRASGEEKAEEQFEITYEGYAPGGVAVLVEVVTDNRNRTVSDVRNAFTKCGGTMGESGCVNWMFSKRGIVLVGKPHVSEEQLIEWAIESGADDVADAGESWEISCDPKLLHSVRFALSQRIPIEQAEVQQIPQTRALVEGKEAEQVIRLLEMLEDLDDVLHVAANCDFPD